MITKPTGQPLLNHHYTTRYYTRYIKTSLMHRHFVKLVDRREPVLSYLKKRLPTGSKLLDIGCGNGNFLHYAQTYFDCTGIDVSDPALKLARVRANQSTLLKHSIYQLSKFPPQSFKVITCFDVLEHVVNLPQVLQAINRCLTSDGLFALAAPNFNSVGRSLKGQTWLNYREVSHLWFYNANEWSFILKQSGFIPQKLYFDGLSDPPYFAYLPHFLQEWLIKYPTQAWSLLGLPLPAFLGENLYLIATKSLGFQNQHYQTQLQLSSQP